MNAVSEYVLERAAREGVSRARARGGVARLFSMYKLTWVVGAAGFSTWVLRSLYQSQNSHAVWQASRRAFPGASPTKVPAKSGS